MQSSRFHSIAARFSPGNIVTSFRRSSSASSGASSNRSSVSSASMSPVDTINSVIVRQPSIVSLEEERKDFGSELSLLEPRPIVYWESLEERISSRFQTL